MKIKDGFIIRTVGGSRVVVATGKASKDFNGVLRLNECGGFLWDLLENDMSRDSLVCALLDAYEVDRPTAERDVDAFVATLRETGVLND